MVFKACSENPIGDKTQLIWNHMDIFKAFANFLWERQNGIQKIQTINTILGSFTNWSRQKLYFWIKFLNIFYHSHYCGFWMIPILSGKLLHFNWKRSMKFWNFGFLKLMQVRLINGIQIFSKRKVYLNIYLYLTMNFFNLEKVTYH